VVIDEHAKGVNVLEILSFGVILVADLVHRLMAAENVFNGVVHRVVKQTRHIVLVRANVGGVAVEALSHLEDTSSRAELLPEGLGDLGDRVDSNTIEAEGVDEVLDPALQLAADVGVVLVEIRQVSEAAVLDLSLVVPVGNLAVSVIVACLVVRSDLGVVRADRTNVVGNNVDHHPDALRVTRVDEVLQVLLGTEVAVVGVPVGRMVAVVAVGVVRDDG
jgi:hypothetical protein